VVKVYSTAGDDTITVDQIGPGGGTIYGDNGQVTVDAYVPGSPNSPTLEYLPLLQLSKVADLVVNNLGNPNAVAWSVTNGESPAPMRWAISPCSRPTARRAS
jgi:hypothetical protein